MEGAVYKRDFFKLINKKGIVSRIGHFSCENRMKTLMQWDLIEKNEN